MTATEVLHRMLDERGVEYTFDHGYREFFWDFGESGIARASAIGTRGLVQMIVTGITPEQAIAATLGATDARPTQAESSGTCTVEGFDDGIDEALDGSPIYTTPTWYLSCGHTCEGAERPSFCKNCGRKVVSE